MCICLEKRLKTYFKNECWNLFIVQKHLCWQFWVKGTEQLLSQPLRASPSSLKGLAERQCVTSESGS